MITIIEKYLKSVEHGTENIQTKNIIINYKNLRNVLSEAMNTFNEVCKKKKHQKAISNHHINVVKFDSLANTVSPLINARGV